MNASAILFCLLFSSDVVGVVTVDTSADVFVAAAMIPLKPSMIGVNTVGDRGLWVVRDRSYGEKQNNSHEAR